MLNKILELDSHFPTGERTLVRVAGTLGDGRRYFEKQAFDKAAASPAYDYLQAYRPDPGTTIILVNALGAFETYDDNKNGDGFPERPYKIGEAVTCGHAKCQAGSRDGWISEPETLVNHYKTFEAHGGIYKHHKNKDPSKSLGKVDKAIWSPRMRRVELVLAITNEKDPQLIQRIDANDDIAVSMGCHVKWDVCTICGHRAPTRKEYCVHARDNLRKILADGRKVSVLNPRPRFFDISMVYRPADRTGYMMRKLASHAYEIRSSAALGELVEKDAVKSAAVSSVVGLQRSILQKTASGALGQFLPYAFEEAKTAKECTRSELEALSKYPLLDVLGTLAKEGAPLTTADAARLYSVKTAGVDLTDAQRDCVVYLQDALSSVWEEHPSLLEKAAAAFNLAPPLDISKTAEIQNLLKRQVLGPTSWMPNLPIGPGAVQRGAEPPRTDTLTLTDPATGERYITTRGAAMASHLADSKNRLGNTALFSALYFLGSHALSKKKIPWWLRAPASLAAGYATTRGVQALFPPYRNPYYQTDQGLRVSGGTEFMKESSDFTASSVVKVAADFSSRVPAYTSGDVLFALRVKLASTPEGRKALGFSRLTDDAKLAHLGLDSADPELSDLSTSLTLLLRG